MDGSCHVNSTDVWRVAASNRLVGGNTSIHPVVVVSNNININNKPHLLHMVYWESFDRENFHGFFGLRATHETFLHKIWAQHIHLPY